jgi:hypothetical protein
MADAAKCALQVDTINVVADAGSNGEHFAHCEAAGIVPYLPVMRTVNNQGDGTLFAGAQISAMRQRATPISAPMARDWSASIRIIGTVTRCTRLLLATAEHVR